MAYLDYISDENLISIVRYVLDKGRNKKSVALEQFNKNVIDPFGAIFESASFNLDHKEWKNLEITRQCQKTLQNHIGEMHQKILGCVAHWDNLVTGSVIDLVNHDQKIIAEIKNKYNTVTGAKLSSQYYDFSNLISNKSSMYKNYTAYFVNIIPKSPVRSNIPFTPSDNKRGVRCELNENIRMIDGASFYDLVTKKEGALKALYIVLPDVIEYIFHEIYKDKEYSFPNKDKFGAYFNLAYG